MIDEVVRRLQDHLLWMTFLFCMFSVAVNVVIMAVNLKLYMEFARQRNAGPALAAFAEAMTKQEKK
jgi:hypothetical protein